MRPAVDYPRLETERLVLRGFTEEDAPQVQRNVGRREVAATTLNIPHPYSGGMALDWIATHGSTLERGEGYSFAVCPKGSERTVIGTIGFRVEAAHRRAELGYLVAVEHWGNGYATEASEAVLRFGFEELGLNRIFAHHFANNPASGRVLQKLGMSHEGTRRSHTLKWGEFLDSECYAILADEWRARAH